MTNDPPCCLQDWPMASLSPAELTGHQARKRGNLQSKMLGAKETTKKMYQMGNWLEEVRPIKEKTEPHLKAMWGLIHKWLCWQCHPQQGPICYALSPHFSPLPTHSLTLVIPACQHFQRPPSSLGGMHWMGPMSRFTLPWLSVGILAQWFTSVWNSKPEPEILHYHLIWIYFIN